MPQTPPSSLAITLNPSKMKKTILPFTPPCSTRIMILKPLMMMTIKSRFLIYSNAFLNTKDFTGGYDDDVASISDTMIVKTDRTSKFPSRLLGICHFRIEIEIGISSSQILDNVIRDDPFTQHEFLHELGKVFVFPIDFALSCYFFL